MCCEWDSGWAGVCGSMCLCVYACEMENTPNILISTQMLGNKISLRLTNNKEKLGRYSDSTTLKRNSSKLHTSTMEKVCANGIELV